MRSSLLLVLAALFLTATAFAGEYQIVYQEQSPEVSNYVHIDPIIDETSELAGFIYCDNSGDSIMIDRIAADSLVAISLGGHPKKTINLFRGDTLVVYVLYNTTGWFPHIAFARLVGNDYIKQSVPISHERPAYSSASSAWQDIGFDLCDGHIRGILFQQLMYLYSDIGGREDYYALSSTSRLDTEINEIGPPIRAMRCRFGNLTHSPGLEMAGYEFREVYRATRYGDETVVHESYMRFNFMVTDSTLQPEHYRSTIHTWGQNLFVGDFDSSLEGDEVLYYGSGDWLGAHSKAIVRACCYNFAETTPRELWCSDSLGYASEGGAIFGSPRFTHLHSPQHYLAGLSFANDKMLALDYCNGTISDSVALDRSLTAWTFFETGADPSVLNLVGRNADTIFVYQFSTPTDVADEPETDVLPSSFSLSQNYPNPFNNATVISFTNTTRQQLTLRVFNVLGQEVASLHDADTPAGDYRFSWDGLDNRKRPQASGVYFAELQSEEGSRRIKMVLIK